jgi:hypothetical protein
LGQVLEYDGTIWKAADPTGGIPEAPSDTFIYGRVDAGWSKVPVQSDAPLDSADYIRKDGAWELLASSAPISNIVLDIGDI